MIDGMAAVDACYHFAGFVGVSPRGLTLRQLWKMATGRSWQRRKENLDLAKLVWGLSEIDEEAYMFFDQLVSSGKNKPHQYTPEQEAAIEAEVERIRRENPDLPQFATVGQ